MYLTTKQHDQLQILVSGFEIPYRSYIASELLKAYPSEASFASALISRPLFPNSNKQYQTINSEFGKLKTNPSRVFTLLMNSLNAMRDKIIPDEIDVPNVATIISCHCHDKKHLQSNPEIKDYVYEVLRSILLPP